MFIFLYKLNLIKNIKLTIGFMGRKILIFGIIEGASQIGFNGCSLKIRDNTLTSLKGKKLRER